MIRKALATARPRAIQLARCMSTTLTNEEETILHEMKQQMIEKSFLNTPETDMSPELREKLNTEFYAFIKEFVHDYNYEDEIYDLFAGTSAKATNIRDLAASSTEQTVLQGNMKGYSRFPRLDRSSAQEPYTPQELYVRQLFHASKIAGMGAQVTEDVYRPHEDIFKPKTAEQTSLQTLISAGAHLGHHTSRLRASTLPFIYGVRQGIHIIDLNKTMTLLRRAAAVTQDIAERGGTILFVGTRDGQERSVQMAAGRCNGYYVHTRWVPGTLSNAEKLGGWERHEVDMGDKPTGRAIGQELQKATMKPDLVVILNPVENRALISECIAQRLPTIGIIDTDSEPSLVTYPIPANDDSIRSTDLIVGVLSNAAKKGRAYRLQDVSAYQKAQERAKNAEGFNKPQEQETAA